MKQIITSTGLIVTSTSERGIKKVKPTIALRADDFIRIIYSNIERTSWKRLQNVNELDAQVGVLKTYDEFDETWYLIFLNYGNTVLTGIALNGDENVYVFSKPLYDSKALNAAKAFIQECTPLLRYVAEEVSYYRTQCGQIYNETVLYEIAEKVNSLERIYD